MPAADLAGAARRRVLFALLCLALAGELALIAVVAARGDETGGIAGPTAVPRVAPAATAPATPSASATPPAEGR